MSENEKKEEPQIRIVVLQSGWVHVGPYVRNGLYTMMPWSACIRKWGSSHGLGQLAASGPTDQTILDWQPKIEFHTLTEIQSMVVSPKVWKPIMESKRKEYETVEDMNMRIAVLQFGWVLIGDYGRDGFYTKMPRAATIRLWGTDAGLGQLAVEGKQHRTKLDWQTPSEFHALTEIFSMVIDGNKWKNVIDKESKIVEFK